ncbi:CD276 antigen homolog [Neolamprologus brichardi]|uniref:CD276 antigen homolog n=1 Tax=Neolamprologus brichardi TaxID=32507 RepID=UPI001643B95E|nr:CD276 antigen homolog [Neolamprologus brichardi]
MLNHKIITASSGQKNVTLTCRTPDNNNIVVKWTKADMKSEYVLLYRDEVFVPDDQHPSFKDRVDLQDRQMRDGDVSLILENVTTADSGTYECYVVHNRRGSLKLINIVSLSVDPPDQAGGHTEVGEKKDGVRRGRPGLIAGVIVFGVMVALGFFARTAGISRTSVNTLAM